MWHPEKVLGVSTHADDLELGAGATVRKWVDMGSVVYHIILSTLKQFALRKPEIHKANAIIGILSENITIYDFENKRFNEHRQEILQIFYDALGLKPDVVLIPCSFDTHQDHEVVHKEAIRAFRNRTILGYEDVWNMYESNLRLSITLEERHIRAKCQAIAEHKSQSHREYMNDRFVTGMATVRGMALKQNLAENFEVVRWIL